MNETTFVSFYLERNAIYISKDVIRALDSPKYLRFRIHKSGKSLLLEPYDRFNLSSIKVPKNLDTKRKSVEMFSKNLCVLLATHLSWETNRSYRVPGIIIEEKKVSIFDLSAAYAISPVKGE